MNPVALVFIDGSEAARRGRSEKLHHEIAAALVEANVQWQPIFVQLFAGKFHIMSIARPWARADCVAPIRA